MITMMLTKTCCCSLGNLKEGVGRQPIRVSRWRWPQFVAGASASLGSFSIGLSVGYSSTAIPSMQKDALLNITQDEAALVGSMLLIGVVAGNLLIGGLLHFLCHRSTILCVCPLAAAGWLLIYFSSSISYILCGRIITGLAKGLMQPAIQLYTSEIADSDIRGIISAFPNLFLSLGVLASYIAGGSLNWNYLAGISCLFPILTFICLLFIPSSPRNLITMGKLAKAENSMNWLRSKDFEGKDIHELATAATWNYEKRCWDGSHDLLNANNLKPIILSAVLLVFQRLSGVYNVILYTTNIFQQVSQGAVSADHGTMLVGVMKFVGHVIAAVLADRVGRKPLLMSSASLMAVSLLPLGFYFYFSEETRNITMSGWIPVLSLMGFMFFFSIGFGTIPFIFLGEVLPPAIRGKGSTICYTLHALVTYLHSHAFFFLDDLIYPYGVFWLYSVICFLSCLYIYIFLPETKGKSLEDISDFFNKSQENIDEEFHMNIEPKRATNCCKLTKLCCSNRHGL